MERERITISIKKDILGKVDGTVDGIIVRNRSHAIEHLITQALSPNQVKNAVLLVGGKNASKMLPEVLESIALLKQSKFDKVIIALGYHAKNIKDSLAKNNMGLDIEYSEAGEGTGGALLTLKSRLKNSFIVINPGSRLPENIDALLSYHRLHKSIATIATNSLVELKGCYVLEPEVFSHIPEGFSMLEEDIFPQLIKEGSLVVYPLI